MIQRRAVKLMYQYFAELRSLPCDFMLQGAEGPASVFINVICDRKRALDPVMEVYENLQISCVKIYEAYCNVNYRLLQSFIIPVNIRVTDVNDNAPQFINAPYLLNVSEVRIEKLLILSS